MIEDLSKELSRIAKEEKDQRPFFIRALVSVLESEGEEKAIRLLVDLARSGRGYTELGVELLSGCAANDRLYDWVTSHKEEFRATGEETQAVPVEEPFPSDMILEG